MTGHSVPTERWEEQSPGNVHGTARALTTLAAMPSRGLWRLRVMFWVRRHVLGRPAALERLSFIHFARTAIVSKLPGPGGAKRRINPTYIYFESHFNGEFDAYIEAFAYVVPKQMQKIWSRAYDFPGPQPATDFKRYIRERDYRAAHFYSAYPDATAREILRAIALSKRLQPLATKARDAEPDAFAGAWYTALREPRPSNAFFARVAYLRWLWPAIRRRDVDPNFAIGAQAYGLTVLSPVLPGERDRVEKALKAMPEGDDSPFAAVGRTHFARLVLVDRFPTGGPPAGTTTTLQAHLLLSCVIDGDPDSYLRALCRDMAATVDSIWRHCMRTPGPVSADPAAFQRHVHRHLLKTTTFFAPYADATVEDVGAALDLSRRVERFAARTQDATPRRLQEEFLDTFVQAGRVQ